MTTTQEMARTLDLAKRELSQRFAETSDRAQRDELARQIRALDRKIDKVTLQGLNEAAALVAVVADDLMMVVRSASTGPLDGRTQRLCLVIARIRSQVESAVDQEFGTSRDFPKTEDPEIDVPLPPPTPAPQPRSVREEPLPPLPQVVKSRRFTAAQAEYEAEWAHCRVRDDKRSLIERNYVRVLRANKDRYAAVAAEFPGMPWYFVGIIHGMETGFRFDRHLHNGDPLSRRTVRVPAGRPRGSAPFTWEVSARDALKDAIDKMRRAGLSDWSIPSLLHLWELFNGLGYRFKGLRSPYLWSFSNLYSKGKYVADGVFDPNAVSKQAGAATILKALDVVA